MVKISGRKLVFPHFPKKGQKNGSCLAGHALALLLLASSQILIGQTYERITPELTVEGVKVRNPYTGGFNSPQFSAADLNYDGIQDLVVFDRVGEVLLPFLGAFTSEGVRYHFRPSYAADFPHMTHWMLLRDYNADGVPDLFTYSDVAGVDGIRVFTAVPNEQTGRTNYVRYQVDAPFNVLFFQLMNGGRTQLFVSQIDYPAIQDADCDGDLDVVTFNVSGGYAEFFRNEQIERGYSPDTLVFTLQDNCYGGFFESGITEIIDLSSVPGQCFQSGIDPSARPRHAGSTLLLLDSDADGDQDLLLGDLSFDNLNLLTNGGNCNEAWMNEQDIRFPGSDVPAQIPLFPAAFEIDVDLDGQPDLLAAPNAERNILDLNNIWWYRRTLIDGQPRYELQQRDFLVETTLDLGTHTYPAFIDVNADGLLDLLLGNGSFFVDENNSATSLFLLLNVGTQKEPAYELVDEDYLGFRSLSGQTSHLVPAPCDLDQDGDQDLLIGEETGQLFWVENLAGANNPVQFAEPQYGYAGIDVGLFSTPTVADITGDGLPDLIIGERNGNVNFLENIGSQGTPVFNAELTAPGNSSFYGQIDARQPGFVTGYSSPVVVSSNGQDRLLCGTQRGDLLYYDGLLPDPAAALNQTNAALGDVREGFRVRPGLADLDSDGLLEMVVGNQRGGIAFYQTDLAADPLVSAQHPARSGSALSVFPNPFRETIHVVVPADGRLELWDMNGRLLQFQTVVQGDLQWSVDHYPAGVYIIRFTGKTGAFAQRVIKK